MFAKTKISKIFIEFNQDPEPHDILFRIHMIKFKIMWQRWNQENINSCGKRQSKYANSEMTWMLDSLMDFKAATIKMFEQ